MPRYRLTIEYAGTRYRGWQAQANARTVQGELQRALARAAGSGPVACYGSGRTDAGVHALRQVAHADFRAALPPATLVARVNEALPHDIVVRAAERVSPRFHARHGAVARSYLYQVARRPTAFAKPFVWWVRDALDLARMREAAAALAGFGDFRAFTDDDPEEKSTEVLVEGITIAEHGALVLVRVTGSHFLWKMVRRLTGILVEVGRGGLAPDRAAALVGRSGPGPIRRRDARGADPGLPARLTAPASGLFLEYVYYEGDDRDPPLAPACLLVG